MSSKLHGRFKYVPFTLASTGFIMAMLSLKSVYIGPSFSDISTYEFFFEEALPITYWVGLATIVVAQLLSVRFLSQTKWPFMISSWFLMVSMSTVLSVIMSRPFNVDVLYTFSPWMATWLGGGIQLTPNTYPYGWPVSFLIAYAVISFGVPIDVFFMWGQIVLYGIEIYLIYAITSQITEVPAAGALATFLFALNSTVDGYHLNYSPQLFGEMMILVCLYLCLKSFARNPPWRMMFVFVAIYSLLLILSHHLSLIYFVASSVGLYLLYPRLTRLSQSSSAFRIRAYAIWFSVIVWSVWMLRVYSYLMVNWTAALIRMLQHALIEPLPMYTSVNGLNFLRLSTFDKIIFLSYTAFILSLTTVDLLRSKLAGHRLGLDEPTRITISLTMPLAIMFVLGMGFEGLLYPFRILTIMLTLCMPLASRSYLHIFSGSRKARTVLGAATILVAIFGTLSIYRLMQRTVPQWEAVPKWEEVTLLGQNSLVISLPSFVAYACLLLVLCYPILSIVSSRERSTEWRKARLRLCSLSRQICENTIDLMRTCALQAKILDFTTRACPACGVMIRADSNYCDQCGTRLDWQPK